MSQGQRRDESPAGSHLRVARKYWLLMDRRRDHEAGSNDRSDGEYKRN